MRSKPPNLFVSQLFGKPFLRLLVLFLLLLVLLSVFAFLRPSDEATRQEARKALLLASGVEFEENAVEAKGIRTTYLETGSGPSLVLLHGAGQGGVSWYPLAEGLSKKFRLVIPDLPGYGESDKPDALYDSAFFTAWLDAFLDAKNLSRVRLIGSSQGGAVALHYALAHPEKVERLVLVGSGGIVEMPAGAFVGFALENTFPDPFFARGAEKDLFANPARVHPAWSVYGVEVLRMPGGKNPFWQGRGRVVEPLNGTELSKIRAPLLLVWGEKDAVFPLEQAKARLLELPRARLVVLQGTGHLPYLEKPEAFLDATRAFLEEK